MRETVAAEPFRPAGATALGDRREPFREFAARSQIVWGEHCTECAYPLCYASCAFYDPRPDLHCRRFEHGLERVGPGVVRVRFRRWGKLEGQGPAPLRAWAEAARRERVDTMAAGLLARAPLPFAVQRHAAWRWNTHKARPPAGGRSTPAADAFVVEGWSVDGRPHPFTLTFLQEDPKPAAFQTHFTLAGDLRRLSVPVGEIAAAIGLDRPYRIQIEPVGEAAGVDVAFALADFVAHRPVGGSAVPAAPLAKVLVWDLDETLWTGTLAEDGPDGVTPRPEAMAAIRALDARGVLQSVASKNDPDAGRAALRRHGLEAYVLHPQIGWGPKSRSVATIAARLDLGLDSFVFVDDQPFERAEVQAAYPAVRVLAHTDVASLPTHPWFDHPATPEAARRRGLYQAEAERTAAREVQGGDELGFLRASDLVLDIRVLDDGDVARVHELSQRTNQLNFTGAKLGVAEVERMAATDPCRLRLTFRCADRWGDYGLIGFAELDLARGALSQFFMSCRVQRKRVEHAAFAYLAARLRAAGAVAFAADFRATERNGAAARLLEDLGFAPADAGWTRDLDRPFADAEVVRVAEAAPAARAA